jgi:hypothetical protein
MTDPGIAFHHQATLSVIAGVGPKERVSLQWAEGDAWHHQVICHYPSWMKKEDIGSIELIVRVAGAQRHHVAMHDFSKVHTCFLNGHTITVQPVRKVEVSNHIHSVLHCTISLPGVTMQGIENDPNKYFTIYHTGADGKESLQLPLNCSPYTALPTETTFELLLPHPPSSMGVTLPGQEDAVKVRHLRFLNLQTKKED